MTTEVASLKATFLADTSQLERGASAAKAQLTSVESATKGMANSTTSMLTGMGGRLTDAAKSVGDKMAAVGGRMTLLTAPITVGFMAGIKVAADFETSMAEIQARTGLTAAEMKKVGDFAMDMGAKTAFSAQDAADGMLQLLSSGQDVSDAMATLKPVMDLAVAGTLDLGYAADAVTDVMAQYGLGVEDATRVTNALNAGASVSSATVTDLVDGLSNVGPLARNMGLSLEDTVAVLATFSENGIKGAEAGTALKSMLTNMTTNEGAIDMLDKLNISLYDMEGNMRPLPDIISDLNDALIDSNDEDRIGIIKTLGGAYGQIGLSALLASPSINIMKEKMAGTATAAEVAEGKMGTFAMKVDTLKGTLETVATKALTPLIGDLGKLAEKTNEWITANPEATSTILKLAGAAIILGPALAIVGSALSTIATLVTAGGTLLTGLGALATLATAALGPIGALAVGALAASVAIAALSDSLDINTGGDPNAGNPGAKGVDRRSIAQQQKDTTASIDAVTAGMSPEQKAQWMAQAKAQIGAGQNPFTGTDIRTDLGLMGSESPVEIYRQQAYLISLLEGTAAGKTDKQLQSEAITKQQSNGFNNKVLDQYMTVGPSPDLETLLSYGLSPAMALQELQTGGLAPSDALFLLTDLGVPPNITLQQLVNDGLLPSSVLNQLAAKGYDGSASLYQAMIQGLIPSGQLNALLSQGLSVKLSIQVSAVGGRAIENVNYDATDFHAEGGPVFAGQRYWVGERGPEPFIASTDGYMLSHEEAKAVMRGGGGNGTITININGALDPDTIAAKVEKVLRDHNMALGVPL